MKKIICPIDESSRVSQWFGEWPKFYKKFGWLGHPGIDYAVVEGTPVMCCEDGEVVSFEISNTGWGVHVVVQHKGYKSLYAHLSDLRVVDKCFVTRGQVLGRSGNTGNSTGPHLHFGIREPNKSDNGYGGYVDPCLYLNEEIPLRNIKNDNTIELATDLSSNEDRSLPINNKADDVLIQSSTESSFDREEASLPSSLNKYNKLFAMIKTIIQIVIDIIYTGKYKKYKPK